MIPDARLNSVAEIPAVSTPPTVPMVATSVFFVKPPIKSMVTSVVMMQMNTADQNGEKPR